MPKKIYFVSDFHLGIDCDLTSADREKKIVKWLDLYQHDMEELYLVGDIFDYWYEYKRVVPKGYTRLFGKLAELRDNGIPIFFFTGNHDMWMFSYFKDELGIPIYRKPIELHRHGKRILVGHGDGLGPGDKGYKIIKSIFSNNWCQRLFSWIHPNIALSMMQFFSSKSRAYTADESQFKDLSKEWLVQYCERKIQDSEYDYFVFGHRHLPINHLLSNGKSRYINLGEWMYVYSYATFDGSQMALHFFESKNTHVFK